MGKYLESLQNKRRSYRALYWVSTRGGAIRVWEMDDQYIENALKKCVEKQLIAERLKDVMPDINVYEGKTYDKWIDIFKNEYLFRQAMLEKQYEEIQDHQLAELSRDYYEAYSDGLHIDIYDFCD